MTHSHDSDENDSHSHHSNDITIGNARSSDVDENSIEKEKYEANADVEEVQGRRKEVLAEEDYPDGGLRAWLIVVGVCHRRERRPLFSKPIDRVSPSDIFFFPRGCVTLSRRMSVYLKLELLSLPQIPRGPLHLLLAAE